MIDKALDAATTEFPHGTVTACTPADRAGLTDLHRASYPQATLDDLAADVRDEEAADWVTYKDEQGSILVAMHVYPNGLVYLLANTDESKAPEVRHGFLMLAQKAQEALTPRGIRGLCILHSASLQPLAKSLESSGFLSKEVSIVRTLHFSESGEVMRLN
jgi:hypothetical protein